MTPQRRESMNTTTLTVHRCDGVDQLGRDAAALAADALRRALAAKPRARMLLAAAPSQTATLAALATEDLAFDRIDFFHMDDYIGLDRNAPQGFGNWLEDHFFRMLDADVSFCRMSTEGDPIEAAAAYATRIGPERFDVTLCGLGVNAHLAFNDPPADFDDPLTVRAVALGDASRQQQVDEGHFAAIHDVPTHAITVTVPRLLAADLVVCSVPGAAKRGAVAATIAHDPDPHIPGTALKLHPAAHLFVDTDSHPQEIAHA